MNFREKFEQWHLKRYGYKAEGSGTALNYTYKQPTIQQRWEGWQACNTQSFEDGHAKGLAEAQTYGWLLAVDEALVCSHLGVAELSHSYEYAKAKLNELICWNIQLEKDLPPKWVSVKERLPECDKQGTNCTSSRSVLVRFGESFGDPCLAVGFMLDRADGYGPMWVGHSGSHNSVTHWMEILPLQTSQPVPEV